MTDLKQAAQQALEALEAMQSYAAAERKGLRICDEAILALRAALAEPEQEPVRLQCTTCGTVYADGVPPQVSDYERGFVDGMSEQAKRSVDKAVNRMAEPRPIQECYGDCPTNPQTCPNPCNFEGRPKPKKNPFDDDAERYTRKLHEERESYKALFAEHKPEQEPVAWYFVRDTERAISFAPDNDPAKPWQPLYTAPPEAVEPIAWMVYTDGGASAYVTDNPNDLVGAYRALPLFTAPTPRKPLTPEQLTKIELGLRVYADSDRYDLSLHDFARAIERAHGIGEQHE